MKAFSDIKDYKNLLPHPFSGNYWRMNFLKEDSELRKSRGQKQKRRWYSREIQDDKLSLNIETESRLRRPEIPMRVFLKYKTAKFDHLEKTFTQWKKN